MPSSSKSVAIWGGGGRAGAASFTSSRHSTGRGACRGGPLCGARRRVEPPRKRQTCWQPPPPGPHLGHAAEDEFEVLDALATLLRGFC
jgi:hypothetical protein